MKNCFNENPTFSEMKSCCQRLFFNITQNNNIGFSYSLDSSTLTQAKNALYEILSDESQSIDVLHTRNGAPYIESFMQNIFISLSDENKKACALAIKSSKKNRIAGVGVDLANIGDFLPSATNQKFINKILSDEEKAFLHTVEPKLLSHYLCALFSAKESTIKSLGLLEEEYFDFKPYAIYNEISVILNKFETIDIITNGKTADFIKMMGVKKIQASVLPGIDFAFSAAYCMV